MASSYEAVDIDVLERRLLSDSVSNEYNETDDDSVLYHGSFEEMEDNFMKYQTAQWILYSILLILAWGIGILMLLYLPIRIYVCRKDFRSRKLYLTSNAIVYKVNQLVRYLFLSVTVLDVSAALFGYCLYIKHKLIVFSSFCDSSNFLVEGYPNQFTRR